MSARSQLPAGGRASLRISQKRALLVVVLVVVAYIAFVFGWAARPLSDTVPVGIDWSPTTRVPPEPQQRMSVEVDCNNLFASTARGDDPLPVLTPQPPGQNALAFQRTPCELVHDNARTIFALNTLAAILVLAAAAYVVVRRPGDATLADRFAPAS